MEGELNIDLQDLTLCVSPGASDYILLLLPVVLQNQAGLCEHSVFSFHMVHVVLVG